MKLRVLALDYDGTIASDGTLHADVRAAIADVRRRGIVVVLATGRILSELRVLVGDLDAFDAVVAENGALLALPHACGVQLETLRLDNQRRRCGWGGCPGAAGGPGMCAAASVGARRRRKIPAGTPLLPSACSSTPRPPRPPACCAGGCAWPPTGARSPACCSPRPGCTTPTASCWR